MATSETAVHPAKAMRQVLGLRLVDVAEKAGISVSYLSMIEHGLVPPEATRERIVTALDAADEELFG
jgi:transcriptional regulator with XRE-family HTH domain